MYFCATALRKLPLVLVHPGRIRSHPVTAAEGSKMETRNESLPEKVPRRATPVLVPTGCRTRVPTQMDVLRREPSPKRILSTHWMR